MKRDSCSQRLNNAQPCTPASPICKICHGTIHILDLSSCIFISCMKHSLMQWPLPLMQGPYSWHLRSSRTLCVSLYIASCSDLSHLFPFFFRWPSCPVVPIWWLGSWEVHSVSLVPRTPRVCVGSLGTSLSRCKPRTSLRISLVLGYFTWWRLALRVFWKWGPQIGKTTSPPNTDQCAGTSLILMRDDRDLSFISLELCQLFSDLWSVAT